MQTKFPRSFPYHMKDWARLLYVDTMSWNTRYVPEVAALILSLCVRSQPADWQTWLRLLLSYRTEIFFFPPVTSGKWRESSSNEDTAVSFQISFNYLSFILSFEFLRVKLNKQYIWFYVTHTVYIFTYYKFLHINLQMHSIKCTKYKL
jgi:hypothetical protein